MVLWAPHARSNKFFTSLRPGHGSRPCCNSHPKAVTLLSRCCQQAMVVADLGLRCDALWLARPQAGRRSDKGTQKQHVCAWEPPVCICNDSLQPAETVYGCRPGKPSDRSHHCLQHSCKSPNHGDAPLRATLTSDGKNNGSPLTYMLITIDIHATVASGIRCTQAESGTVRTQCPLPPLSLFVQARSSFARLLRRCYEQADNTPAKTNMEFFTITPARSASLGSVYSLIADLELKVHRSSRLHVQAPLQPQSIRPTMPSQGARGPPADFINPELQCVKAA